MTKNIFAENLRELRDIKGLSQSQLARKIGISKSSINSYELGINYPKVEVLIKLCLSLETNTNYLLGFSDEATINVSDLNKSQKEFIIKQAEITREEFIKTKK